MTDLIILQIVEFFAELVIILGDYMLTRKIAKKHFFAESLPETESFKKEIKIHRQNVRNSSGSNRRQIKESQSGYWEIMRKFRIRVIIWILLGVIIFFVYQFCNN